MRVTGMLRQSPEAGLSLRLWSQEQQYGGRHGTAQEEEDIIASCPVLWTKRDEQGVCHARGEQQRPSQQGWINGLNQAHKHQENERPRRRQSFFIPAHQGEKDRNYGY